eukprot:SAG22_NODE_206_length_15281_cov_6.078975_3_plen_71_part_00
MMLRPTVRSSQAAASGSRKEPPLAGGASGGPTIGSAADMSRDCQARAAARARPALAPAVTCHDRSHEHMH